MGKLKDEFLTDKEIIFMGYSSRNPQFSGSIYKAMTNAGYKVYPVNTKQGGKYDIKVYGSLSELPKIPSTAYVLMSNKNAGEAVKQLKDSGVKKILFHIGKTADKALLDECAAAGIETAVACPMMIFGSGLHKFHAFFAGVK